MGRSAGIDLAKIRHPREREVFWASVLANAAVIALAVVIAYFAPEWLSSHRRVTALVDRIRLAVVAAILLLPLLGFLRHGRWAFWRENSVRLGRDQVPEIFAILERHCHVLGLEPPELYASLDESVGISTSTELFSGERLVVLGPALFAGLDKIEDRADVLEFVLGQELGRLALGHTSWQEEILLGYLKRIPVLRLPLLAVQTASRDRFAATLSPGGIRGLVFCAVGGDLLGDVNVAAFVRQAMRDDTPPRWRWFGALEHDGPPVAQRVRELYRSGFLDLDRNDGRREPAGPDIAGPGRVATDEHRQAAPSNGSNEAR